MVDGDHRLRLERRSARREAELVASRGRRGETIRGSSSAWRPALPASQRRRTGSARIHRAHGRPVMASNALAIESMLPALPAIGEALGVDRGEPAPAGDHRLPHRGSGRRSWLMAPCPTGSGARGCLVLSLSLYAGFSLLAGIASSFELLLGARFLQGVAAAATGCWSWRWCATATRARAWPASCRSR
jgi:MFS family permease